MARIVLWITDSEQRRQLQSWLPEGSEVETASGREALARSSDLAIVDAEALEELKNSPAS